jgi:MerR family redox-sensitive transcriptional activator SoxR
MLSAVPRGEAVGKADWQAASARWRAALDARIALLERLRGQLDHCIGCGCLSLDSCPLYNPSDEMGRAGPGPRRWTGTPSERGDDP